MGVVASLGYTDYYGVAHKVDITLDGHIGSTLELTGTNNPIVPELERLNATQLFQFPINKSNVTVEFYIDDANALALVETIVAATEGNYKLKYYKDNVLDLTVDVLADQITYNENSVGRFASVTGKDFSILNAKIFPLQDARKPIIEIIADALKLTGYDLPITTVTSWVNTAQSNVANDFLRELYNDSRALRVYADEQNTSDRALSAINALELLLKNYKLFLKQDGGRFYLDQFSGYTTPTAVLRTLYDKDGTFVSQATVNKTVAVPNSSPYRAILGISANTPIPSFKRATSTFNHRLVPSGIVMPQVISFDRLDLLPRSFGQDFVPNDERRLSFSANVQVVADAIIQNGAGVEIEVRSGARWWNNTSQQWVSNVGFRNLFRLSDLVYNNPEGTTEFLYNTVITINTLPIPSIGGGDIEIVIYPFDEQPSTTTYTGASFTIVGVFGEELTDSERFQIEQAQNASLDYDDGIVLYGDGPTAEATSAIRFGLNDANITVGNWRRRGTSDNYRFSELLLKEIMDFQRNFVRNLNATIRGDFRPSDIVVYDNTAFYFTGGSYDVFNGVWNANLVAIAFADALDTFDVNVISGPAQLTAGIYSAIQQNIGRTLEAGGMIAYRLVLPLAIGEVSQLVVQGDLTTPLVFEKDSSVRVINFATNDTVNFVVAEDQLPGSNVINVVPKTISQVFPAGSFVVSTQQSLNAFISITRNTVRILAENNAVGELASNVNGTVTSLDVFLFEAVQSGQDFVVFSSLSGTEYTVTVDGDYNGGRRVAMDIQEQFVQARAGDYVWGSGAFKQAELFVSPGEVLNRATRIESANSLGDINQEVGAGPGVSSLILRNTATGTVVLDNSIVIVETLRGDVEEFVVNGEQTINTDPFTLQVDSKTTTFDLDIGDSVVQPAWNATGLISAQAGTVVLKATLSSGSINKLALVRLDAAAADGSTIQLQADQILVTGQTTFLSALRTNGIAGKDDVSATIRATTAPTVRADGSALVAGDTWIKTDEGNLPHTWSGSAWIRDYTIIDGGNITTGTIDAQVVDISSGDLLIDSDGITMTFGAYGPSNRSAGISWVESSTFKAFIAGLDAEGLDTLQLTVPESTGFVVLHAGTGDLSDRTRIGNTEIYTGNKNLNVESTMAVTGAATFDSSVTANSLIVGTQTNKATISYTTNTARTLTIPSLGGNATFAFIDIGQTFSGNNDYTGLNTFYHGNLLIRNSADNGSATLNYGTASVDRTYTFSGASGTVWHTGNLGLTVSAGTIVEDTTLEIEFGGNRYSFRARLEP
jgi:hypothetical protein